MGGKSAYGDIIIQLDNSLCFNGQEVTGIIHVNAETQLAPSTLYLIFIGQEHTEWQESRTVTETDSEGKLTSRTETDYYEGNYNICDFHCQIYNFQFGVNIGIYSLPFSFILPKNIPGSFFYEEDTTKASIAYRLQVNLVTTNREIVSGEVDIHIPHTVMDMNTDLSVSKKARMKTWCCIDKGSCEIQVSYPQETYNPSQIAEFKVVVNNSQSKISVNSVACSFGYFLRLKDSERHIKLIKDTLLRSQVKVNIGPQAELLTGNSIQFQLDLPSKINLLQNMYSTEGKLIECIYKNHIEATMNGCFMCCGERPSASSIMTIVPNAAILPSAPKAPEDWQPRLLERVNVCFDSSNDYQAILA